MIDENYMNVCSEVLAILDKLKIEDYEKIPKSLIEGFEKNKNPDYTFEYDYSKRLVDQKTDDLTKGIISNLFRDYIASGEEREAINKEEQIKIDEEERIKREKYNPDILFSKPQDSADTVQENSLIKNKESIFKRIINKLKSLFKV